MALNENSMFVNNFSLAAHNTMCVLEAKTMAPNIESLGNGKTAVFGSGRIVDEAFLFMEPNMAKELAISILVAVSRREQKIGIQYFMQPEKKALWNDLVEVLSEHPDVYPENN